ncbi:hypothetical protein BRC2024_KCUCJSVR_CDS_0152 [Acinetobacter phage vB_AbaM_KissB]
MSTYFSVETDTSKIIIDDNFSNLAFVNKFQVVIDKVGWFGDNFRTGTLTISNAVNPVIAIKTSDMGVCLDRATNESTGVFTYIFKAGKAYSNTTITVYVFDSITTQGNFGLQTFDASGKICFDSTLKYMRVKGSVTFTSYEGAINWPTLPTGNYAFVVSACFGEVDEYHDAYETGEAFAITNVWKFMIESLSTGARGYVENVFNMRTSIGNTSQYNYGNKAGSILLVDVTGL